MIERQISSSLDKLIDIINKTPHINVEGIKILIKEYTAWREKIDNDL